MCQWLSSLKSVCGNVSVKAVPAERIIYLEVTILAEAKVVWCDWYRLCTVDVIVWMVQVIVRCHCVRWICVTQFAGIRVRTQVSMHHSSWPVIRENDNTLVIEELCAQVWHHHTVGVRCCAFWTSAVGSIVCEVCCACLNHRVNTRPQTHSEYCDDQKICRSSTAGLAKLFEGTYPNCLQNSRKSFYVAMGILKSKIKVLSLPLLLLLHYFY